MLTEYEILFSIQRSQIIFLLRPVSFHTNKNYNGFVTKVTISQRSFLNKVHVCREIISCHKTPWEMVFIATTHEYEAELDISIYAF